MRRSDQRTQSAAPVDSVVGCKPIPPLSTAVRAAVHMRALRWADPPDSELRLVDAAKATSFALLLLGGTISIALCIAMLIVLAVGALLVAVRCCRWLPLTSAARSGVYSSTDPTV